MTRRIFVLLAVAFPALAVTDHPAAVAGIYEANLKVPGTSGRKLTLNLAQDGAATFRSELVGKDVKTSAGKWSATGDEVRADFDTNDPAPMVWKLKKGRLIPKEKGGYTLRKPR